MLPQSVRVPTNVFELDYLTWVLGGVIRLGNTAHFTSPSVMQALGLEMAFI